MGWANGGRTGGQLEFPVSEKEGEISERNMNSQQKGYVYKSWEFTTHLLDAKSTDRSLS